MAAGLDTEQLRAAFQSRPDLVEGIQRAADSPARVALFNSISGFVCDQLAGEPSLKRRRVDDGGAALPSRQAGGTTPTQAAAAAAAGVAGPDSLAAAAAEPVLLEIKEISLSIPQRKKFDLCFTKSFLYARAAGGTGPAPGIVYAWADIEYVFHVPVPEKAQVQHNYLLFPRGAALAALSKPAPDAAGAPPPPPPPAEPLVFTVPATAPKPGSVGGSAARTAEHVADSYGSLLQWALENQLRTAAAAAGRGSGSGSGGQGRAPVAVVGPNAAVFHSAARQAYRPGEKAVHVRAFRGSKDGYLFFLPTGILWGFKKPLLFLPLDRIAAFSYTSVLQRTFNIVVEVDVGGGATAEVEFGMIDQEDYGGIDETYVRRHGLQDQSMAEQRKAKRELAENARDGGGSQRKGEVDGVDDAGAAEDGDEEMTELQRAEKQLQDAEDDEEEDYDPGSDGYSDGSGATSEEEEEGEEGEDGEDGEDDDSGEEGDEDGVKEEGV